MEKSELMKRAIRLSDESVERGGGPFGAVVVRNGEIVGEGRNCVTLDCDPTAHAEVMAIRDAARRLGDFNLSGCEIYTSCEPCPMCLGAIYWARLDRIYYANTRKDAAEAGFSDDFIYREIDLSPEARSIPSESFLRDEAIRIFDKWRNMKIKTEY